MGGAEALVPAFASVARERGIDLTVCARTTIEGNPIEAEISSRGVAVENLDARRLFDVGSWRRLSRLVDRLEPDLIHAHLTYSAIWGAAAGGVRGIPVVASLHVPPSTSGLREMLRQRLMVSALNRWAARVVVVSDALRKEWEERSSLDRSRLRVVHNGIALADQRDDSAPGRLRRELHLGREDLVIVVVSVLREGKGIDVLLHAMNRVIEEHPECRLVIVGDGPMKPEWMNLGADLRSVVRWTGFRRDVPAILAAADLFVLPTLADAFPTVLLEAFAAGLPVVASDVGGVPEIVDEPLTGLLVPPGDPKPLEEAMIRAIEDREWRVSAGRRARERVEREYAVERWADRLQTLYDEVLGEPTAGGDR